ncbi:hypothetical protein HB117_11705 [Escherichia coli]|nr:hypothetical protein HB117_11705 [Escherichia coli]
MAFLSEQEVRTFARDHQNSIILDEGLLLFGCIALHKEVFAVLTPSFENLLKNGIFLARDGPASLPFKSGKSRQKAIEEHQAASSKAPAYL